MTSSAAEALALVLLEALIVIHQRNHVARRNREHREEADQRTKRERGAVDQARQQAAHDGHRQDHERQARQAPAPESRLQEQEDPDRGDDPEAEQAARAWPRRRSRPRSPPRGTRAGTGGP